MRELAVTITVLALITLPAKGQLSLGSVSEGHELAQSVCAACHRVEKGQASEKLSPARAFQDIANNPARTELSLRVFLKTPHINMPNLILTETETDNIITYILSLK